MTYSREPGDTARRYAFYHHVMQILDDAGQPFLVGGGFALEHYAGIRRDTKDMDLFLHRRDLDRTLEVLSGAGLHTEHTFTHWLAKALGREDELVDLIYSSGNGVCPVDDDWFRRAPEGTVLGRRVRLMPAEEMIWQKAFILGRDRSDVADVAHILQRWGDRLDWDHMLTRFGENYAVLLAQVVLFQFIYPAEAHMVPDHVLTTLQTRMAEDRTHDGHERLCRGTLLSIQQFEDDLQRGWHDGRLRPVGNMSEEEIEAWKTAFPPGQT